MTRHFFQSLESAQAGDRFALEPLLCQLNFDHKGLLPVITQRASDGEVLMMAWMNAQALRQTLDSGRMTYWSRSRQCLWLKGETSGHTQKLIEMRVDCDGDTLLCRVEQEGPACHTGRSNCFYFQVDAGNNQVCLTESRPVVD